MVLTHLIISAPLSLHSWDWLPQTHLKPGPCSCWLPYLEFPFSGLLVDVLFTLPGSTQLLSFTNSPVGISMLFFCPIHSAYLSSAFLSWLKNLDFLSSRNKFLASLLMYLHFCFRSFPIIFKIISIWRYAPCTGGTSFLVEEITCRHKKAWKQWWKNKQAGNIK